MRGNFYMVTTFAVAFVLSRVFSAPVTQTYKMVRYHSNECNNTINTRNSNAKFYVRFSGLITFVTVNPAKLSQSRQRIIRTPAVISCFDLTTMLGKALRQLDSNTSCYTSDLKLFIREQLLHSDTRNKRP